MNTVSRSFNPLLLSLLTALYLTACSDEQPSLSGGTRAESAAPAAVTSPSRGPAAIDQARYANAGAEPANWVNYGNTWNEQRFSTLDQINESTVGRLGLAWTVELGTMRGVEATPLIVDGVLYNISAWSVTTAYNAATGEQLWQYDPKVPPEYSRITCCGTVSRGVSAWHGKIIIPALDGRLIAVDAATGAVVWETDTKIPGQPLSITGAPRMANGLVVIGNSGGDVGSRGYVSAYDADTGEKVWRFFIVPGKPGVADGEASDSIMAKAAATWTGEWWKLGGGGNAWDGIAYDPELNLVYFATGNGSPHHMKFRSPQGGDNLFLCSIVAVDAGTGEYRWHYQEIPAEQWDYDCTAQPVLADLTIDGVVRKVIMHAPKHAYYYVIDRASGELLSAEHYVPNTNWSSHVDMATGRPVINPVAMPTTEPVLLSPGFGGGHTWNPMSYSPQTGLAYIPAHETYQVYSVGEDADFKFSLGRSTWVGGRANPDLRRELNQQMQAKEVGYLLAWDPVKQQEAWRVPHPHAGSGGTLTTAGNLVVQSTIGKTLSIYRADNGELLWEMPIDSVAPGGPVTYMVDGRQYIAINAGWNSAHVYGLDEGGVPFTYAPARLLAFALDATGVDLPPPPSPAELVPPPATRFPQAQIDRGEVLFSRNCQLCHGSNAIGGLKDLRYMTSDTHAEFSDIVLRGLRADKGMPKHDTLSEAEVEDIHAYVISRAQEDWQGGFMQ
ncbi:MAG: PQQ-dependent dehydrogenase, methanol/ethanol family [Gammaproteobacteria bacterium]|nr:PQQ-dependent dehydrogenase, methanol/ethanol family [Gammaproteobacteria bacterium]